MECKKCKGTEHSKNGFIKGHQRYKCKKCGYQFTLTLHKGFDEKVRLTACLLYINGLSLRTIAKLLNTSATTVLSWVKKFAILNYEKPKPVFQNVTVELNEMLHFLHSKKLWIWKAYCRDTAQLIDWECGNRDTYTLNKMLIRLKKWNIKIYITDDWKPYEKVISQNILLQSKNETYNIKRNNFHQRHWFARFRRKTCVVSRSLKWLI